MKCNKWFPYSLYSLMILVYFFSTNILIEKVYKMYHDFVFEGEYLWLVLVLYWFLMFIVYVFLGVLMGGEYILNEKNKPGTWKIKLPKIILMGIPLLIFSLRYFIYASTKFIIFRKLDFLMDKLTKLEVQYVIVFQILFGYFLITSFYKDNSVNQKVEEE